MTISEQAVRDHLRREYRGVFSDRAIERHLEAHVGPRDADQLVSYVLARRPDALRVLDVGCGYGSFVRAARVAGLEAIGVDTAAFELTWAREQLSGQRPEDGPEEVYIEGDAQALPFEEASFDVVSMWNVLEHVPDGGRAISEAARVVRPGGSVFVLAPNYAAFRSEAHYQVPWFPLMPRRLAVAYLRALGRDPGFYRNHVFPCTMWGSVRAMKRSRLRIHDGRIDSLSHPTSAQQLIVHAGVRQAGKMGLLPALRLVLRLQNQNPLGATIMLEGIRR